ncbi:MAG: rhodanese-like domain-containing protein [Acidobacteria bacterium]|nr:rhodanese-like domain-containing protein [Acidobacteriota bacterium]
MTTPQTNRPGGQGQWLGGFAAGVLVVGLGVGVWWWMQEKKEPPAPQPVPETAQQTPQTATPAEDHDHAALEAEIAKVPRISPDALAEELKAGTAVVIDVRDQRAYIGGHIPDAMQIPLQFVEGEIPYFPKDKKLVTYCSCPAEETSGHAVLMLQKGGLTNVAALQGGYDLWVSMKLPTETGLPGKK